LNEEPAVSLSDLSVELGVIAFVLIYVAIARVTGKRFQVYRCWALVAAMTVLILTLAGPIDELEDRRLFAAHMIQHLILALIEPPLLLLGTPDWVLRPLLSIKVVGSVMRILTYPLIAYLLYNMTLVGMHSPWIFDLMCRNEGFHITMHLLLLGTAVLLWWPLLSPLPDFPRISYPAQLLYIFFWLIPMAAVAAPITMATTVLYPWYLEGPHPFGISPMSDQVLGGVAMWVGAGVYVMGVFTAIYFYWAQREDLDEPEFNLSINPAITEERGALHN
jgi:putative membrane protein